MNAFAFTDINFAAVGDFDCPGSSTSNQWKTMHNIESRNAERVLLLGDYSYRTVGNVDCWAKFLDDSNLDLTRVKQTVGNHETDQSGKLTDFVNTFKPYPPSTTTQYYDFTYQREAGGPKIFVLVMSTEQCKGSTDCPQYNFANNELNKASKDPSIQWIIVDYHKVMYVSPNECSTSTCVGSTTLRSAYNPLFDKYGVDIVLQGHVHNYERSKLIKYSGGSSPTIVQSSTTSYTKSSLRSAGEIFATVGTGGVNFHGWKGKSSFITFQKPSSDATFGILDLSVINNGAKLVGKYINNGGSVKDTFTITKTLPSSVSTLSANEVPSALNQSVSTSENTAKPITLVAKNKSNGSLQYSIVTPPLHGELAGKRPSVVYIPSANYTGKDQFTFTANNGRTESNLATVNITINKTGPSSNFLLDNVSKALAEKEQTKSLGERGEITTNQTERSQIQQDITKPLIPERQSTSNQSEPLQSQRDLTKPLIPKNQTEANVDLTKDTKKNVKPIVKNIQPEANAGKNQIAPEGSQVILDGSKSKDRDGKIESYRWQQILGPSTKVALDNPNNIEANFISPQVSHDTILVFKLTVIDDKGSSDSAITAVKVVRNEEVPPVSSSNVPDSSTSNLQNSSNRIEGVGNSTIERIRP